MLCPTLTEKYLPRYSEFTDSMYMVSQDSKENLFEKNIFRPWCIQKLACCVAARLLCGGSVEYQELGL